MSEDEIPRQETSNIRRILKKGQRIEVIKLVDGKEAVYASQLIKVEGDSFFITGPIRDKKEPIKLEAKQEVFMSYRGVDALYEFNAKIEHIIKTKSGILQFQFGIPEKAWRIQRRNYFRVSMKQPIKFREMVEKEEKDGELEPKGDWEKGFLVNVSGGGVAFLSNKSIPVAGCGEVEFATAHRGKTKSYQEAFRVARVKKVHNKVGRDTYEYATGAYFTSMTDRAREELVQLIFEKQMEIQRKLSG